MIYVSAGLWARIKFVFTRKLTATFYTTAVDGNADPDEYDFDEPKPPAKPKGSN